jgi:chemotaxis protein histidine kinase CheA
LREIGNDGRICDLIDSQVAVIEAGTGEISSDEARAALRAAFASVAGRLAELGDDAAAAPVAEAAVAEAVVAEAAVSETVAAEAAVASPSPAPQQAAPVAVAETVEATPVEAAPVEMAPEAPTSALAPAAELASADAEAALAELEAAEAAEVTDAAADAHDEAVLDIIAQEMGAPDEFEADDTETMIVEEAHIAELAPAEPEIAAEAPEPIIAELAEPPVATPVQAAVEAMPQPAIEISLGSSIIASGLLRKSGATNDPLAPIRRMSQAEKIAFFS